MEREPVSWADVLAMFERQPAAIGELSRAENAELNNDVMYFVKRNVDDSGVPS
jgi:hypothetical protein